MTTMDVSVPAATLAAPSRVVAVARWLASLRHLSLLAVLAWTAHAHWSLALWLGAPAWLAACLPVAVDAYVLAALREWTTERQKHSKERRRALDLLWALGLDSLAVAAGLTVTHRSVEAVAAAVLGVVLVLVLWRVHALDAPPVEVRQRTSRPGRERRTTEAPPLPAAAEPLRRAASRGGAPSTISSAKAERDAWVAQQRAAGRQRGDVVSEAAERFGCGRRSAERSWDGVAA